MSRTLIQEGLKALSEQEFIKNILKKEPQSSGDFLANYVTSGQAGRNAFVPGKDINAMGPLEKINYLRKAKRFSTNNTLQDKPVPGRNIPGAFASPVDDPTGQVGRQGLPGGQTAQSTSDMTFGDIFMADPTDPGNRMVMVRGKENIDRVKQDLVDRYGPDVDKGSRRASAEEDRAYQQDLLDRRNSTLSQNNIFPLDRRSSSKKALDRLSRSLGGRGSKYDDPSQNDPTTIRYKVF